MRTVCVVTGTRAEYGILRPVMRAIEASANLRLQVFVTGMHLEKRHGETIAEVRRDFEIAASMPMSPEVDTGPCVGKALGQGIAGMVEQFERLKPDVVMVLGDRVEALAGALAGLFCGGCVAHVHGGEVTRGGYDEVMRHAITKLAHLHFAATEQSMERIIRMGERAENVFLVGAPGLDEALAGPSLEKEELAARLDVDLDGTVILVVQHPVSTRPDDAGAEMTETMEAVLDGDATVVVVYPNNDPGGRRMIEVIRGYEGRANVRTFPNIARTEFLSLLRYVVVLVGNSSSGIIEAPSFALPVVNVGERQAGRERAANVIDVAPRRRDIRVAVRKCLHDKDFRQSLAGMENPWGDGHAAERIVEILETVSIDHELLQKQLTH